MMAACVSTPPKGQRATDTNEKAIEMKGGGFKSYGSAVASAITHSKRPQALEGLRLSKQDQ